MHGGKQKGWWGGRCVVESRSSGGEGKGDYYSYTAAFRNAQFMRPE